MTESEDTRSPSAGRLQIDRPSGSAAVSDRDVLDQAARWAGQGRGVALATVVRTWGSSPRPAGSQCAISDSMELVGSVSGGCVEGAVIRAAEEVIEGGSNAELEFQVADEEAWEVGLACGGRVVIRVDRVLNRTAGTEGRIRAGIPAPVLSQIVDALDCGGAAILAIGDEEVRLLAVDSEGTVADEGGDPALIAAAERALRGDRSQVVETASGTWLVRPYLSDPRLVIVGAVHIAQPLAVMAQAAGLEIVVVDPRAVFATPERFPGVRLERSWPDAAYGALGLDHRTAVVSLSHDPKLDDPALAGALRSAAFYVGALGSRRTHEKRVARLLGLGFDEGDIARISAPVGLDIGARSPAEIAVAILSEVILELRRGTEVGAG